MVLAVIDAAYVTLMDITNRSLIRMESISGTMNSHDPKKSRLIGRGDIANKH